MYHRWGFKIKHIHSDGQFEHIRKFLSDSDANLNTTWWNEHMQVFERFIRTVKEIVWAIVNQLPFETYLHRLIVEMIYNIIFWLNSFPLKDGIHNALSPHTIMTGLHINHNCKLEFGTYVHIHEEHDNFLIWCHCLMAHRQHKATHKGHTTSLTLTQDSTSRIIIGLYCPCWQKS